MIFRLKGIWAGSEKRSLFATSLLYIFKARGLFVKKLLSIVVAAICLGLVGGAVGIYLKIFPSDIISQISPGGMGTGSQNTKDQSVDSRKDVNPERQQNLAGDSSEVQQAPINSSKPNLGDIKTVSSNNISKLSRVYSAMKPEEAVAILNGLDDKTIVAILQKMKEEQAAKILARMDSQQAGSISRELLLYKTGNNTKSN